MKRAILAAFAVIICTALSSAVMAEAPMMHEQFVYRWNGFDGKGYSGGFIPRGEDTLYFIANKHTAMSGRKTLVYFWPITGKYMAGWKTLNEEVKGKLEILKDGEVIDTLEQERQAISYPEGYWGDTAIMYVGDKAEEAYQGYRDKLDAYYEELKAFYEARTEYQKKLDQFFKDVKARRDAGEEGPLDIEIPTEPQAPEGVTAYVTEPDPEFIVNLPPGEYAIRLRAPDGTVIQGSEKKLVTFTSRRTGGIGYQIVPGNKWTRQEPCNDPAKIIYGAGKNTLYLQPFVQDEYPELEYQKFKDPQNFGREDAWTWVHTNPIKDGLLIFQKGSQVLRQVDYLPYRVKQVPGAELGYEIIPYDEAEAQGRKPTFEGHRIEISPDLARNGQLYLQKKGEQTPAEGSQRTVRLVNKESSQYLYVVSVFPLIIGGVLFVRRRMHLE